MESKSFDESIATHQLVLQELDLAIIKRQNTHRSQSAEIKQLERSLTQKMPKSIEPEQQLADTLQSISIRELQASSIESELPAKQSQLDRLIAQTSNQTNEIEICERDLKMTQLELSSSLGVR